MKFYYPKNSRYAVRQMKETERDMITKKYLERSDNITQIEVNHLFNNRNDYNFYIVKDIDVVNDFCKTYEKQSSFNDDFLKCYDVYVEKSKTEDCICDIDVFFDKEKVPFLVKIVSYNRNLINKSIKQYFKI